MPGHPFYFALELSGPALSAGLLDDLTAQVLRHVGCSSPDVPELQQAVAEAAAPASTAPGCLVQFSVEQGALQILVSSSGRRLFQASHRIPDRP